MRDAMSAVAISPARLERDCGERLPEPMNT